MIPTRSSKAFGRRLRGLREDLALSQPQLCASARIPQHHLSKLERGERMPNYQTLRRLARFLGTDTLVELLDL